MAIISADFFKSLTDVFCIPKGAHIAVGVSGGADSLCLTVLLSEWAKQNDISLTALTVNHRLRAVAEEEAYFVAQILKKREIEHVILTNETPIPETGLEVYARQVRYGLIYDYCKQNNITHLFLAHHQLDQAETFLLRFGKKTGLTGLSGMRSESCSSGSKKSSLVVRFMPVNCGISSESVAESRNLLCNLGNCPITVAISS